MYWAREMRGKRSKDGDGHCALVERSDHVERQQGREKRQVHRPFLHPRDFLESGRVDAEVDVAGGALDDGRAGRSIALVVEVRALPRVLFDVNAQPSATRVLTASGVRATRVSPGRDSLKSAICIPLFYQVTAGASERLVVDSTHDSRS